MGQPFYRRHLDLSDLDIWERQDEMPALIQEGLVFFHYGIGVSPGEDQYVIRFAAVYGLGWVHWDVDSWAQQALVLRVIINQKVQVVLQPQVIN